MLNGDAEIASSQTGLVGPLEKPLKINDAFGCPFFGTVPP
jgi:hypothetical protein